MLAARSDERAPAGRPGFGAGRRDAGPWWGPGLLVLAFALSACPSRPRHGPAQPEPQTPGAESPTSPPRASGPSGRREAPERGVHIVQAGETLWRISRAYGIPVDELARANGIAQSSTLSVGQRLVVPEGEGPEKREGHEDRDGREESEGREEAEGLEVPPASEAGKTSPQPTTARAKLAWPILGGVLYARFGPRGEARHDGIDIAVPEGTVVRASGAGKVLYSGEQRGYGHVVIVEQDDGLLTIYAHNSENLVAEGRGVQAGDPVAKVGEGGRTSGPHLHFEVREGGAPRDPLRYLPPPR